VAILIVGIDDLNFVLVDSKRHPRVLRGLLGQRGEGTKAARTMLLIFIKYQACFLNALEIMGL
jgi:hypothetical protein